VGGTDFTYWLLVAGGLLIFLALAGSVLKRLPLTTAMVYLAVGVALGPYGLGLIDLQLPGGARLLERISEIAVLISLFATGLMLRAPPADERWRLPIRLASLVMLLTIGLIALAGVVGLGLPLGAAILLGAILAPTDPVLASDVQVEHPGDRDRLRFSLTGEAGLNDGSATPLVLLGLGLLGHHDLGALGWRWLTFDVLWAVVGGLAIGWLLGMLVGRLVLYLRHSYKEAVGLDDFLALGLIGLSYAGAQLLGAYGFLAVFAAGLALRQIELRSSQQQSETAVEDAAPTLQPAVQAAERERELATDPQHAPAYMAQAVLGFNEQLERIGEVAVVVLLGGVLSLSYFTLEALWFVPLALLVIRPVAVWVGLAGLRASRTQRNLIAWFGIRGIGSIYYLTYALGHGVSGALAERLIGLTLAAVAVSIVVHGISVTPLMNFYARRQPRRAKQSSQEAA
jgi:NhaP-type Na+/H+ or K+/H+ antiporter